jgi:hypothetical protein
VRLVKGVRLLFPSRLGTLRQSPAEAGYMTAVGCLLLLSDRDRIDSHGLTIHFYYGDHRRGAHAQYAGGIADAAAVERQVDHLAADYGYPAAILILQEKDAPRASTVVTLSVGCRWIICLP